MREDIVIEVVVPLFNEHESLPVLLPALEAVVPELRPVELLFVDDGSKDGTADALAAAITEHELPARLLRHRRNLGLSQALRTGFAAGRAPIQCWLDADLSYAPDVLPRLVGEIERGADLALASPYHPEGSVENVPPLRLWLSRGLSRAYRLMGGRDTFTYSGMVRAWRRECLGRCLPERDGHLGVTESLLRAKRGRARVVEVPATLRGRAHGSSGLRLVPGIIGQVGLLRDSVFGRI